MKLLKTEEAEGQVLFHDLTRIIKGVEKGPAFKKGHVITKEDIPVLLKMGKDNVYVCELDENTLHEDDAARILYELCTDENMRPSEIREGKIEIISDTDGLFKVDRIKLNAVNSLGDMMIATRHGNFPVRRGDKLAATRIIPLVIDKSRMDEAREAAGGGGILKVLPFKAKKAGIVTTGNEVFYKRIKDEFTPVILEKLSEYDVQVVGQEILPDDVDQEVTGINKLLDKGADMIICTGGMSVDPDDRTPLAIRRASDSVVTYGSPVLPGAMFMLAYKGEEKIPIMGLPGCVMYARRTIFDLVLPRIMAGEILEKKDIDRLGEGGLCLSCENCTFPNCGFGKA